MADVMAERVHLLALSRDGGSLGRARKPRARNVSHGVVHVVDVVVDNVDAAEARLGKLDRDAAAERTATDDKCAQVYETF